MWEGEGDLPKGDKGNYEERRAINPEHCGNVLQECCLTTKVLLDCNAIFLLAQQTSVLRSPRFYSWTSSPADSLKKEGLRI